METKTNLIKESMGFVGVYTFTKAFLETPEQWALHNRIEALRVKFTDAEGNIPDHILQEILGMGRKLNAMCRTEITEVKNLIPTVGRTAVASWLTNASPSPASMRLNVQALGTGGTAPAAGDTQLQTETGRAALASATNTNNVCYLSAYWTATQISGTFLEAGIFMNGVVGTPNSGTIFSHVAINITKDLATTLTIDYTVNLN